jgi:cupin fold WbuC family metalloprotein
MIRIDQKMISLLTQQARLSARKRKNLNFHTLNSDPLQRMLHAMEPDTYVQPHKHENPDKREAFIILKGQVAVIEYTDEGEVRNWIILDPATGNFGAEFAPGTWHSLIVLETGTVVYEAKDGPWDPSDDKFFAVWAPKEGDAECRSYNNNILKRIGFA